MSPSLNAPSSAGSSSVLSSPLSTATPADATACQATVNHDLHDFLASFWLQEEVPSSPSNHLTPEEAECEAHFKATHSRDASGRYIVRLPFKSPTSQLGDYRRAAQGCLQRLLRRLSTEEPYRQLYSSFLQEYEELRHMIRAPVSDQESSSGYYLPHHGVLKEDNLTTKLRVVFNGSSPTSSGISLNDILHTGAKLQPDISDVLLWVRRNPYIFITDIKQMFRQIKVHPDDWIFQQILWIDAQLRILVFLLTTVTYGTKPAPFLAGRTLLQLVEDKGLKFPLAIIPLLKGRYVDDISGGADSLDKLIAIALQLVDICKAGGFTLAKWQSNHPDFCKFISPSTASLEPHSFQDAQGKILGLAWQPHPDHFVFSSLPPKGSSITKRTILSEVAQLFDPLGFLSPVIIRAKMLLQELWLEKVDWDDPLPPRLQQRWIQFRGELENLTLITVPRYLDLSPSSPVEIHGFSDASQLAMAAAVYLKITPPSGDPIISLVCAKTKVASLKRLTIPRLKLTAAMLLARLVTYVQRILELAEVPTFLWTDSSVALTWISSHPSRWKEYVSNRVSIIQGCVPHGRWRFVPGSENPADCATRGLSAEQLTRHSHWWRGPSWLALSSQHWPDSFPHLNSRAILEERPGTLLTVSTTPSSSSWDLLSRYSSLTRLLRITATCQRCCAVFQGSPQASLANPLTPADLEVARRFWVQMVQSTHYASEIRVLSSGNLLPKTHPLSKLTAFIDHSGILRVGGRLKNALLDPDTKHPAILPREDRISQLIIADAHRRTLHGGTQLTLSYIRRTYWIIGGQAPVRSHILRCVRCARYRGVRAQQLMGQLPPSRVTPSRPFLTSGVDYAGPITLKTWRGRGAKCHKGWLAIFVCFVTSAVHLEAVTEYTTEAFLAAFRRFTGRRGICHTLFSDYGTNFLGADASLKRLFNSASKESQDFSQLLSNDGTHWVFNPPAAPHFGGKWEAAVKSVKYHLRRTIGEQLLTYEELTTLLVQIEGVLNSRPLCPLSDDPEDLSVLTPGHFLIGEAPSTVPEPSLSAVPISRITRWQLI